MIMPTLKEQAHFSGKLPDISDGNLPNTAWRVWDAVLNELTARANRGDRPPVTIHEGISGLVWHGSLSRIVDDLWPALADTSKSSTQVKVRTKINGYLRDTGNLVNLDRGFRSPLVDASKHRLPAWWVRKFWNDGPPVAPTKAERLDKLPEKAAAAVERRERNERKVTPAEAGEDRTPAEVKKTWVCRAGCAETFSSAQGRSKHEVVTHGTDGIKNVIKREAETFLRTRGGEPLVMTDVYRAVEPNRETVPGLQKLTREVLDELSADPTSTVTSFNLSGLTYYRHVQAKAAFTAVPDPFTTDLEPGEPAPTTSSTPGAFAPSRRGTSGRSNATTAADVNELLIHTKVKSDDGQVHYAPISTVEVTMLARKITEYLTGSEKFRTLSEVLDTVMDTGPWTKATVRTVLNFLADNPNSPVRRETWDGYKRGLYHAGLVVDPDRRWQCQEPGCDLRFTKAWDRLRHEEDDHGDSPHRRWVCPDCGKGLYTLASLSLHKSKGHPGSKLKLDRVAAYRPAPPEPKPLKPTLRPIIAVTEPTRTAAATAATDLIPTEVEVNLGHDLIAALQQLLDENQALKARVTSTPDTTVVARERDEARRERDELQKQLDAIRNMINGS